jgi:spermidine/putrescine transport system substrate-binding protein
MRKLIPFVIPLLLIAACSKLAPKTVTVFMWSEYMDPALIERFEKETGLKIVLDTSRTPSP